MATDVITAATDTTADVITVETADSEMVTVATETAEELAEKAKALLLEKNLKDSKDILATFGLIDPFKPLPAIVQMKLPTVGYNKEAKKRPAETTIVSAEQAGTGSVFLEVRKSARLMTKPQRNMKESELAIKIPKIIKPKHENVMFKDVQVPTVSVSVDQLQPTVVVRPTEKPESYGAMPEFDVGYVWKTKLDCVYAGIHRSCGAICSGKDGAYSICLSLSHEEDVDLGDCFTYTMSGRGKVVKKSKKSKKSVKPKKPTKPKKSVKSKPVAEKPVTENPVTENPEAKDTQKPEADKQDTQKPEADKPDTQKPEADKPDTQKPEADKPDTQKPEADKPDAQKPEADKPDAQKPEADKPDAQKPEAKPDTQKPEADKPDAEKQPKKPKKVRKVPEYKLKKDLVLAENMSTGNQVRVIRGYRFASSFAPKDGYRYDGVYSVEKQWCTTDLTGKQVWKYALRRCDPTPPPWQLTPVAKPVAKTTEGVDKTSSPDVVQVVVEACAKTSSPNVDIVLEGCQKNNLLDAVSAVPVSV